MRYPHATALAKAILAGVEGFDRTSVAAKRTAWIHLAAAAQLERHDPEGMAPLWSPTSASREWARQFLHGLTDQERAARGVRRRCRAKLIRLINHPQRALSA